MSVIFMRHGHSLKNDPGFRGDQVQAPLSNQGRQGVIDTAQQLADRFNFDLILSSPVLRALQTARLVRMQLKPRPPLKVDDRLRGFESKIRLSKTRVKLLGDQLAERRVTNYILDDGQKFGQVAAKMKLFLDFLRVESQQKDILLVAHDQTYWLLYHQLNNRPVIDLLVAEKGLALAGWTEIEV